MNALRVGIACNIKTDRDSETQAEFDEPGTVDAISNALQEYGCETIIMEATEAFPQKLAAEKPDIVFNIAEGTSGRSREAQIPAILDYYGVPYTGSDAVTLAITLDKAITKQILRNYNVLTPPFFTVENMNPDLELTFPVIVKPNAEGSGKGISGDRIAENPVELRKLIHNMTDEYGSNLLAEQYIGGREFTVGILGNGSGIQVLDPMEIVFNKLKGIYKIYSYEVKKNYGSYVSYQCPPDFSRELKANALTVYKALGCLDFARIDFRLGQDDKIYFLEINPLPGLAPGYSDLPILAEFNGIKYNNLICKVLDCALKRYGMKDV